MKIINILARSVLIGSMAIAFALTATAALAQQESGASRALEEIIVTARRREETLQNVPVAVQAFSQQDIQRSNILGFEEIAGRTPGMGVALETAVDDGDGILDRPRRSAVGFVQEQGHDLPSLGGWMVGGPAGFERRFHRSPSIAQRIGRSAHGRRRWVGRRFCTDGTRVARALPLA